MLVNYSFEMVQVFGGTSGAPKAPNNLGAESTKLTPRNLLHLTVISPERGRGPLPIANFAIQTLPLMTRSQESKSQVSSNSKTPKSLSVSSHLTLFEFYVKSPSFIFLPLPLSSILEISSRCGRWSRDPQS
jgi:hypothetical protein